MTEVCACFWKDIINWAFWLIGIPSQVQWAQISFNAVYTTEIISLQKLSSYRLCCDLQWICCHKKINFTTCFRSSSMETINKLEDLSVTVFNFNKMRKLKICFLLQFAKKPTFCKEGIAETWDNLLFMMETLYWWNLMKWRARKKNYPSFNWIQFAASQKQATNYRKKLFTWKYDFISVRNRKKSN